MKIYLETSVINFLFAEDAPKKMQITKEFFNLITEYEVFISDVVLLEIEQASEEKKEKLLNTIKKYKMKAKFWEIISEIGMVILFFTVLFFTMRFL